MKVRCTKILDASGQEVEASPWLTVGREYVVLTIEAGSGGVVFGLIGDESHTGPGLFDADLFELTDPHISRRWVAELEANGSLSLAPTAWHGDFWDDFYGGGPDVRTVGPTVDLWPIYREERDLMLTEAGELKGVERPG